jgi:hypothetical protein
MSVLTLFGRSRRSTSKRRRRTNVLGFHQFDRLEERTMLSTIIQAQSFGPFVTPLVNQPLTPNISQFDTMGGIRVLDSVEIQASSSIKSTLFGTISNPTLASQSFAYTASVNNATTSVSGPGISGVSAGPATLITFSSGLQTLPPGGSFAIPTQQQTLTAGPVDVTLTAPAALVPFIGSGTLGPYTTSADAASEQNLVGSSNLDNNAHLVTTAQGDVTVIYTFHNLPSIVTIPGGSVVIGSGAKLTDSATLTNGLNPTGNIVFTLTLNGVTKDTETVPVNGNGTYSTPNGFLPTATGTYQWVASYSGDANNSPIASLLGDEPETVTPASPAINTTPGGTVVIGSGAKLTDTALLSGGFNPTGTITFVLTLSGVTKDTEVVPVNGNGSYSTPNGFLPVATGTYQWVATYNGDANNSSVASALGDEPETVTSASPNINTVTGGTVAIGSGTKLTDSATLAGGFNPTGNIVFTLTLNGVTKDTETVPVNGNGTYSTPNGFLPTVSGTYQWVASYSGDVNNGPVASNLGDEPENVVNALISISPLTPVNEVKNAETFTVTVNAFPAGTGAPSFGPLAVTVSGGLTPTVSGATVNGNTATWTVTVNSDTAGTFTVTASDVVTMGGVTVTRTTGDGFTSVEGNDSSSAVKNYVDALISINPLTATNPVGSPETFTVTVTAFPAGTGAPSFATPVVTVSPVPTSQTVSGLTINGNVATFTITINSSVAGVFTVTASDTVTMGGVAVVRTTGDGFTSGDGSDSGSAVKTYIPPATPALTWGFWKNHTGHDSPVDAWPVGDFLITSDAISTVSFHGTKVPGGAKGQGQVGSDTTMTIGGHTYSFADLQTIFATSVTGNGVINLGHQLIAAVLNAANGAATSVAISLIQQASDLLKTNSLVMGVSVVTQQSNPVLYAAIVDLSSKLEAFNSSGV